MATLAALVVALLLGTTGVLVLSGDLGSRGGAGTRAVAAAEPVPAVHQRPDEVRDTRPPAAARRGAVPVAVVVPALGVDAAVEPIGLRAGSLTPPDDPTRVGWWAGGAKPGATAGTAVLTGHTVHTGGGAFDRLEDLTAGDEVAVRTRRGTLAYEVRSVQVLSRDQVARRSAGIFRQTGAARLLLVTCEGWDGTAFRSNVVVTARPVA